ncbi:MAG TPA: transcriptional regulator GcvA [Caldimonas sp.]|jgi:DNA-binding transcriptional LysR family regulator|nr:transcriptional regulator GcvA [Caldimonas sp.]HEX2540076.1 transcriptional regulator GcvA [Caldimonas sp.]
MRDGGPRRRFFELPPLELLAAFEAAARHLSFTRAGEEIALTQSAVSRQIQALEGRLGVVLFRRLHRALALTDEGRILYAAVAEALTRLDRATRELTEVERVRTVVVTTTPGFAGLWLIPRLATFVAAHPGVDVRISAGNALASLERGGVDVAVRYQSAAAAGGQGVRLFGETAFPVCSPRLRGPSHPPLARPADLVGHTLLRMEPDGKNQLQDWDLWLHAMGLAELQPAGVLHFSSYDQLISAALAGQGIALGRVPLIESHLKSRKLVAPFSESVVSPRSYYMLVAPTSAARPEIRDFTEWLVTNAAATSPGRGRDSARRRGRARA